MADLVLAPGGTWRAPRWAAAVTVPPAAVGLAVSVYLTYVHYAAPSALSCPDTGIVNCTKVTTSAQSVLLGVLPVALAGALYYLAMTALVLPAAWRAPALRWPRAVGVAAGIVMVCYLVFVEAVQLHALCLWCTGVHAATFVLFVGVLSASL